MFPGEATLPASSCSVTSSIPFHCRTGHFVGVFPMDFTKKHSLSGSCEDLLCCPLWQAEPRSLAGAALSSHSLSSRVAPSCVIPCASSPKSVAQTTCLPVWLCPLGVRGPSTKPDHRRLLALSSGVCAWRELVFSQVSHNLMEWDFPRGLPGILMQVTG